MASRRDQSAVRALDSRDPELDGPTPDPPNPRRWALPALVVAGLFAVFFATTGATDTMRMEPTTTTTTTAAPMSAIEPETLDLRTQAATAAPMLEYWQSVTLSPPGLAEDLVFAEGKYLIGGAVSNRARIWWSTGGSRWQASDLSAPKGRSSIQHIVAWRGGLVALGDADGHVGVWTADAPEGPWAYQGELGNGSALAGVFGVATSERLVAVAYEESSYGVWASDDGITWSEIESDGALDGAMIAGLICNDEELVAYGALPNGKDMVPAIWRSQDGERWDPVEIDGEPGAVTALTGSGDMLYAAGYTYTDNALRAPTLVRVWTSRNGVDWQPVSPDEPLFSPPEISMMVTESSPSNTATATLDIDGRSVTVTKGTEVVTDAGSFTVVDIMSNGVRIAGPSFSGYLQLGVDSHRADSYLPMHIAAEGSRIALVGIGPTIDSSPLLWASIDGGGSWNRFELEGTQVLPPLVTTNSAVLMTAALGHDGIAVSQARWNAALVGESGYSQVEEYVAALSRHDTTALLDMLPDTVDSALTRFDIPSLAQESPRWWDEEGNLDEQRVADTVAYLAATHTTISLNECATDVLMAAATLSRVDCVYTVESDLLSRYGIDPGQGRLEVTVRDGKLYKSVLTDAPSEPVWFSLSKLIEDSGQPVELTAVSAREHMDLADQFLADLLTPGETKRVETVLGTMEWTWFEPPKLSSVSPYDVVYSPLGFVLAGTETTSSRPVMYRSADGIDWEQIDLPESIVEIRQVAAFDGGILVSEWSQAGSGIRYFDGDQWVRVDIPETDSVDSFTMAATSDQALVASWQWHSQTPEAILYLLDTSFTVTPVALAADMKTAGSVLDLISTGDRLAAFVTVLESAERSVWTFTDAGTWKRVSQTLPLGDISYLRGLQEHDGRYFVVGEGIDMICEDTLSGQACGYWTTVWTSDDGEAWYQLQTASGDVVSAGAVASGPLGLAAIGRDGSPGQPTTVYLSTDGAAWEAVPGVALVSIGDQAWWMRDPAVGIDRIVTTGSAWRVETSLTQQDPDSSRERLFIIVGRLIDG